MRPLELWGGVECTVNRVGDSYIDQLALTGHDWRLGDLDLFAALGIRALRYPVLWERIAPDAPEQADWRWPDERLGRLRQLDVRPIVGCVHHGSGPRYTSLVDPEFPDKLAHFARSIAERYPWVDCFTPVNEPLTTARFSGLYGHWYPHGKDNRTFIRALLTQCRAVVLAMAAIREITPRAQLMQTDDLGRTSSTPLLRYQAHFENERRWLTFDLLTGRVGREHPLWEWLTGPGGATEEELAWFQEHPCPPDLLGINHYVSSERYLDEDLGLYPGYCRGGNGRHTYADELTARVRAEGTYGPETLLREVWNRYEIPLAVTEAHNGCTREEQMRWFLEVWEAATAARDAGVDIRAVTAWSLLGVHGWDRLVTGGGRYEPGIFDLRGEAPRPTAMVGLLTSLGQGQRPLHPLLAVPGWWRRPDRHLYGFARSDDGTVYHVPRRTSINRQVPSARPMLVAGGRGTLGRAVGRICQQRGIPYRLTMRQELDIADSTSVRSALDRFHPWAVVNAAGYVRVDRAERDETRCFRENCDGPTVLAEACARAGLPLMSFSSDLVFDGAHRRPYTEDAVVAPLNVYGRSKAAGEEGVRQAYPEALIIRTSAFFGPWDRANFVFAALSACAARRTLTVPDQVVSPTYVPDLVNAALDLFIDEETSIWHLTNAGELNWSDLARLVAEMAGFPPPRLRIANGGLPAPLPPYSALGSRRGQLLPDLADALQRYVESVDLRIQNELWVLQGKPPIDVNAAKDQPADD